jgi:hypothetical protein
MTTTLHPWNRARLQPRTSKTVRPGMRTLAVSAKTGEDMGELVALLEHA